MATTKTLRGLRLVVLVAACSVCSWWCRWPAADLAGGAAVAPDLAFASWRPCDARGCGSHPSPAAQASLRKAAIVTGSSAALGYGKRAPRKQSSALGRQLALPIGGFVGLLGVLLFMRVKCWFETPSRPYEDNVGDEYDKWTREGTLEHYWGEHIHMGAYKPMEEQKGYAKNDPFLLSLLRGTFGKLKNFKQAKVDFVYDMIRFSQATSPKKVLDVGCGIGGTSRILAKHFPRAEVVGITLSPEQVRRGNALAQEQGLLNARFEVMDALAMTFEDNSFDLVWGCESLEHMPDKKKYFEEMVRVMKPGGKLAVASWCQRDPDPPYSPQERKDLDFMYEEWAHPYFESVNKYKEHLVGTGEVENAETADWTEQTLPSWRHSVWVGVWYPAYWVKEVLKRPRTLLTYFREVYTLEKFHKSMVSGLMIFGMLRATKKAAAAGSSGAVVDDSVEPDEAAEAAPPSRSRGPRGTQLI